MNKFEERQARLPNVQLRRQIEMEHDCRIDIKIRPESARIKGNASAIDAELDAQIEEEILCRLENGDEWAWCIVSVCAVDDADPRIIGVDTLGCCSFKSENDFIADSYFADLMDGAVKNLLALRSAANG